MCHLHVMHLNLHTAFACIIHCFSITGDMLLFFARKHTLVSDICILIHHWKYQTSNAYEDNNRDQPYRHKRDKYSIRPEKHGQHSNTSDNKDNYNNHEYSSPSHLFVSFKMNTEKPSCLLPWRIINIPILIDVPIVFNHLLPPWSSL